MKKFITIAIALSIVLSGCGHSMRTSDKEYPTYGLFNESTDGSKNVCYKISAGNIFWSIVLVETIIAPIYFIGFSLYNPVRMKKDANDQCMYDG